MSKYFQLFDGVESQATVSPYETIANEVDINLSIKEKLKDVVFKHDLMKVAYLKTQPGSVLKHESKGGFKKFKLLQRFNIGESVPSNMKELIANVEAQLTTASNILDEWHVHLDELKLIMTERSDTFKDADELFPKSVKGFDHFGGKTFEVVSFKAGGGYDAPKLTKSKLSVNTVESFDYDGDLDKLKRLYRQGVDISQKMLSASLKANPTMTKAVYVYSPTIAVSKTKMAVLEQNYRCTIFAWIALQEWWFKQNRYLGRLILEL